MKIKPLLAAPTYFKSQERITKTIVSTKIRKSTSRKRKNCLGDGTEAVVSDRPQVTKMASKMQQSSLVTATYNDTSQMADIAKSLHKTEVPVTQSLVSTTIDFLTARKWTMDDLKNSESFKDIPSKIGLERLRREIFIFENIGVVSFHLLKQVISKNDLDIFQQVVTSWMRSIESGSMEDVEKTTGAVSSTAERLKTFLEVYKIQTGFKSWTSNRLKLLLQSITIKVNGDVAIKDLDQSDLKGDEWTTFENVTLHVQDFNARINPARLSILWDNFHSEHERSKTDNMAKNEAIEGDSALVEYAVSLMSEKARILNNILLRQNVLKEAGKDASQARAAFTKVSLLPDMKSYLGTLLTSSQEWTKEAAEDLGDSLVQFGIHIRDLLQEGLIEPLAAEIQAEEDLANYLRNSPDSLILAGVNAVLNELTSSGGDHIYIK
ncbi:hypothetical protein ONS95_007207 [Cadophora gregata]|uniref:uncharacterized protein n=1 Tax=Cadophora gregata TaxID=51156 RepID=UPI0026DD7E52|nr:uncharacterized protein ONS95_007207 [Cadophora gregata]KAK0100757.1 hypothetical protein ONS95_007207 [Cadophora gregata]KAK0117248.1 hypothetical protein ONS96_013081 [Cadophora gregata f. sp. sojae]